MHSRILTLRARGLIVYLFDKYGDGELPTSTDLSHDLGEGRDVIRAALGELLDAGLLVRTIGRRVALAPDRVICQKPESLNFRLSHSSYVVTTIKDQRQTTKPLQATGSQAPDMNLGKIDDDGPAPSSRKGRMIHRSQRPVDTWTVPDMIAEFGDRTTATTSRFGQVNAGAMAGNISRLAKSGVTKAQIVKSIEMFFADPRNLRGIGEDFPLWKRWVWWFTTNQARVAQAAGDEKSGLDELDEQIAESGPLLGKRRMA